MRYFVCDMEYDYYPEPTDIIMIGCAMVADDFDVSSLIAQSYEEVTQEIFQHALHSLDENARQQPTPTS